MYFILSLKTFYTKKHSSTFQIKQQKKGDYLIYSFFLYFFLIFILLFVFKYVDEKIGLPPHKIFDYISNQKGYVIVLQMLILGPILEEITFRLFLIFTPRNLSLSIGGLSYFLISDFSKTKFYSFEFVTGFKIIVSLLIAYLVFKLTSRQKRKSILKNIWIDYRLKMIYLSIMIFGLIHFNNMEEISRKHILIFPLLISPQILIAFFASYLRVICGFKYAIWFHIGVNFIPVILFLLVKYYG